jgi:hypothetical protein
MLLAKCELFFIKNAKIFILAVVLNFWALFFKNSPGLKTLELHLIDFEPLTIIDRSPEPHTSVHTLIGHSEVPHSSRIRSPLLGPPLLASKVPHSLYQKTLIKYFQPSPPLLNQKVFIGALEPQHRGS